MSTSRGISQRKTKKFQHVQSSTGCHLRSFAVAVCGKARGGSTAMMLAYSGGIVILLAAILGGKALAKAGAASPAIRAAMVVISTVMKLIIAFNQPAMIKPSSRTIISAANPSLLYFTFLLSITLQRPFTRRQPSPPIICRPPRVPENRHLLR